MRLVSDFANSLWLQGLEAGRWGGGLPSSPAWLMASGGYTGLEW